MKKERYFEPTIEENYDETEQWEQEQIIINGKLTTYGEKVYEQSKDWYFDETDKEWILL